MSCRVTEGLLEHETLAKGKKFQASWRKFSSNFIIESNSKPKSRLLMVLYQSGQDTEMGSIECKSMGYTLGSDKTDDTPSKTSSTLDNYFNTKETSCVEDDYKELGVFHPIAMDANAFQRSSSASSQIETDYGCNHPVHVYGESNEDEDLKKAIALSRRDQMNDAMNAENGDASTEDVVLKKALELSRRDNRRDEDKTPTSAYRDLELEEALKRSYREAVEVGSSSDNSSPHREEESKVDKVLDLVEVEDINESDDATIVPLDSNSNGDQSMIDLTEGDVAPVSSANNSRNNKKRRRSDAAVVLDLTSQDVETTNPVSPKTQVDRMNGKERDAVCIVVDSSDDEDVKENEGGSESNKTSKEFRDDNRERKRKLAAEAAMKRLKKWP